ncbi:STAS domain-containing protein [Aurantimonas sp. Leaf443]|uniref:STAS domain-containing protein n=1 Tax=Aurantimonas sp. Leaf443 TaxID=1736378 RepID=UPI000701440F|nr:STAS domain-containing protein [Aurantimonas sp. Leaf443]KQT86113.1 hypothetical protein ASG48_05905 [Aurantimonas sp. Leaf443]
MTETTTHALEGPSGLAQREAMRDALLRIAEAPGATTVALDLTRVSETDAATLQLLISMKKTLADQGVTLRIEPSQDLISTAGRAGYEFAA